jgi:hypothetical protein
VAEQIFWAYQPLLYQNTMKWGIFFEKRGGSPWKSNGKLIEPGYGVYSKNTLIGPTPSWPKQLVAV